MCGGNKYIYVTIIFHYYLRKMFQECHQCVTDPSVCFLKPQSCDLDIEEFNLEDPISIEQADDHFQNSIDSQRQEADCMVDEGEQEDTCDFSKRTYQEFQFGKKHLQWKISTFLMKKVTQQSGQLSKYQISNRPIKKIKTI